MKKLLVFAVLLIAVIASGCGDKFAKEKEAITKAEQAAMAMKLPDISEPDYSKKPSKEDWEKYHKNFKEFIETEAKMLAEMKKSDAKIAELEKTASESEKKDLKAFKDKIQQARIEFVRKVSKGRLSGDTFIVGVGSTWQEIEMVYGQPKTKKSDYDYDYDGLVFSDWYSKGVPPKGYKFVSQSPQAVMVTSDKYVSDAGVKIGMTKDEFYKALKSKYVKKNKYQKEELSVGRGTTYKATFDIVMGYSMQDTQPYNLFCFFENDKLVRYSVSPH